MTGYKPALLRIMIGKLIIVRHPFSVCVPVNHKVTLSVCAEGTGVLSYQWFTVEENEVPGATQAELTIRAQDTQLYVCRVNDQFHDCVFSDWVKVRVLDVDKSGLPGHWQGQPHIAVNPKSQTVRPGERITLHCAAFGMPLPQYRWYRNGVELDKTTRTLQIDHATAAHGGTYLCEVSNVLEEKWTEPVDVIVQCEQLPPSPPTATDKVALLIGNLNYLHHLDLMAPIMDVRELANLLQQLGFRVVSLLDLTREEMLAAIEKFMQLLDKGVYGLFYYAGHGFERAGRNYLVAVDTPQPYRPENSVCVQRIMLKMQQRETALSVILLDTCRKWYYQNCIPSVIMPLGPRGNTVYGYATCEDAEAFEVQDGGKSTGIFTKYLNKHILQPEKVTHILEQVSEDLSKDPLVTDKQAVEIKHTLKEPRSLADPVRNSGHTRELHRRDACWRQANEIPRRRTLRFLCGVEVEICFAALFSNVMAAFATIKTTGPQTQDCTVTLSSLPTMEDIFSGSGRCEEMDSLIPQTCDSPDGTLRLCALQKIREPMVITVDLHYTHTDSKLRLTESQRVEIGKPLVASWDLYENVHVNTQEGASAQSVGNIPVPPAPVAGPRRPFTRNAAGSPGHQVAAVRSNEPEENDENELHNFILRH